MHSEPELGSAVGWCEDGGMIASAFDSNGTGRSSWSDRGLLATMCRREATPADARRNKSIDTKKSRHNESVPAQWYAAGFMQVPTIHDPFYLPPSHVPAPNPPSSVVMTEEPYDSGSGLEL
jgi:hypothetical protein